MLCALPALPLLAGLTLALISGRLERRVEERMLRPWLGATALVVLAAAFGIALWAAAALPRSEPFWSRQLALTLAVDPAVRVAALLVPAIAAPVVLWAAAHEDVEGLPRLVGGLLAFAGAMELLVLAADLLVLLIGWELVGGLSYVLIAHHRRDQEAAAASYAFNATRLGGLGLFLAAGAALAVTGSFAFDGLTQVAESRFGDLFAAGVLCAAASKSAQLPFSPWLMRAMVGPSAVSALLHSSTMVAAGAWLLIRLHEPLAAIPWFGPAAVTIGLATALAGGVAAAAQDHAKRLLAASTAAQYGLMFAAAGAGAAGAALAHLVTHAVLKALLFLAAGSAMTAAGTGALARMHLGRTLPFTAAASAVGALSLAAVPPLGAAWSKDAIIAATGHLGAAVALVTLAAAGLAAFYAARFQLLAFGRGAPRRADGHGAGGAERTAVGVLALGCLALSVLWLPAAHDAAASWAAVAVPEGAAWERPASLAAVFIGMGAAWVLLRAGALRGDAHGLRARVADWLGLPALIDAAAVRPTLTLAAVCARFDDRIVDAGVRGSAWLGRSMATAARRLVEGGVDAAVAMSAHWAVRTAGVSRRVDDEGFDAGVERIGHGIGVSGRAVRHLQTGATPVYYALAVGGLLAMGLVLWLGRSV